jgi:hypothetical protein
VGRLFTDEVSSKAQKQNIKHVPEQKRRLLVARDDIVEDP